MFTFLLVFGRGTNAPVYISARKFPVSVIALYTSVVSLLISLAPHFRSSALILSTPALFPYSNTVIALSTLSLMKGVFILQGFMFSISISVSLFNIFEHLSNYFHLNAFICCLSILTIN